MVFFFCLGGSAISTGAISDGAGIVLVTYRILEGWAFDGISHPLAVYTKFRLCNTAEDN
jgi:hypothetical protein